MADIELPDVHRIAVIGAEGIGTDVFRDCYVFPDGKPKDNDNTNDESKYRVRRTIQGKPDMHDITLIQINQSATIDELLEQIEKDVLMDNLRAMVEEYRMFILICDDLTDPTSVDFVRDWLKVITSIEIDDKNPMSVQVCHNGSLFKSNKLNFFRELSDRNKHLHYKLMKGMEVESKEDVTLAVDECIGGYLDIIFKKEMKKRNDEYKEEVSKNAMLDCCMTGGATVMYDILTIVVSLADISTDLWVLIQWYNRGRMTPFFISLTILTLAQTSYILAFILRFTTNNNFTCQCKHGKISRWFLLPFLMCIAPLLSFVMYFGSLPGNPLYKLMKKIGFEMDEYTPSRNATKIEQFLQEKLFKHMGFLLEAGVEAFPQSILQMSVMVYYSETNWISVASILLSLISVCTKSLVFSYALEIRTMIFNYLSIVLDFISVFALITWVFYNPNGQGLTQLAWIWIYKIAFTTIPGVYISGFLFTTFQVWEDWRYMRRHDPKWWWEIIKGSVVFYTIGLLVSPFIVLMTEMCCCSGIALIMFLYFSDRFTTYSGAGIFWGHVFSFINAGHNWEDKKLRTILVVESVFSADENSDRNKALHDKLSGSRQDLYSGISWSDLRLRTSYQYRSSPWGQIKYAQGEICDTICNEVSYLCTDCSEVRRRWNDPNQGPKEVCGDFWFPLIGCIMIYIVMPTYVLSRVFNFTFVWIAFATTPFNKIDNLQLGMTGLLGFLQLLWFCVLIWVSRFHYTTWHIFPGNHLYISVDNADMAYSKLKKITDLHAAYTCEPQRKQAVLDYFGPDVASVVLQYLPTLVHDLGAKTVSEDGDNNKDE